MVLMLLCLALGSFVLLKAVPFVARRASVYMVHDVREAAYDFGERVPGAAETRLYKDLLYVCASALHTLRSGRIRHIMFLAVALATAESDVAEARSGQARGPALPPDAFASEGAKLATDELHSRVARLHTAAWFAALCSGPLSPIVVVPLYVLLSHQRTAARKRGVRPEVATAKAARVLKQGPTLGGTFREIRNSVRSRAAA